MTDQEREALAADIKAAIADLSEGKVFPDLIAAIDTLAARAQPAAPADPRCAGCDISNGCPEYCWCKPGAPVVDWRDLFWQIGDVLGVLPASADEVIEAARSLNSKAPATIFGLPVVLDPTMGPDEMRLVAKPATPTRVGDDGANKAFDEHLKAFWEAMEKRGLRWELLGSGPLGIPAVPARKQAVGWLPMGAAPKDGTHILAMLPDRDTCYVICWADASRNIRKALGESVGWHMAYDGDFLLPHDEPTHWMPLPAPPAGVAEGGEQAVPPVADHCSFYATGLIELDQKIPVPGITIDGRKR